MSYIPVLNLLVPHIYNGQPIIGGTVEFYEAGSSTPLTVYTDNAGSGGATTRSFTSDGIIVAFVLDTAPNMKQVIKNSSGATLFTFDNLVYDSIGSLSDYLPLAGGTLTGDLNMSNNDIVASGDITIGNGKQLIVNHTGSTTNLQPTDQIYLTSGTGSISFRSGASLGIYDDNVLALSINISGATLTGDLTISSLASNNDEIVTLNNSGKLQASNTTITTVNNTLTSLQGQITSNDSDILALSGDIADLDAAIVNLQFVDLVDAPNSLVANNYLKVNAGGTAIENKTTLQVSADIDHGNVQGLTDDDHTQYVLTNGLRGMSNDLDLNGYRVIDCAGLQSIGTPASIDTHSTVNDLMTIKDEGVMRYTFRVDSFTVEGARGLNFATPVDSTDAATKGYVDTTITSLSGSLTTDIATVTTNANSRVLRAGDTMTGNLTVDKTTPQVILDYNGSSDEASVEFKVGGVLKSKISSYNGEDYLRVYGANASVGLDMGSKIIQDLGNPTSAQHAATKYYVDNSIINKERLVIYVGSAATGDGTGIDSSNRMAINTLFGQYEMSVQAPNITVYSNTNACTYLNINHEGIVSIILTSHSTLTVTNSIEIARGSLYFGYAYGLTTPDSGLTHNLLSSGLRMVDGAFLYTRDSFTIATGDFYVGQNSEAIMGVNLTLNDGDVNIINSKVSVVSTFTVDNATSSVRLENGIITCTTYTDPGVNTSTSFLAYDGSYFFCTNAVTSGFTTMTITNGSKVHSSGGWNNTTAVTLNGGFFGQGHASDAIGGTLTLSNGGVTHLAVGAKYKDLSIQWDDVNLRPITDAGRNLGSGAIRWGTVYAAVGAIDTSDEREKQQEILPQFVLNAIDNVEIVAYKRLDSIAEKGEENARIHYGVMAQSIKRELELAGLDPSRSAFFCYDEWQDENGETVGRYGVRYAELYAVKIESMTRKIKALQHDMVEVENSCQVLTEKNTALETENENLKQRLTVLENSVANILARG